MSHTTRFEKRTALRTMTRSWTKNFYWMLSNRPPQIHTDSTISTDSFSGGTAEKSRCRVPVFALAIVVDCLPPLATLSAEAAT